MILYSDQDTAMSLMFEEMTRDFLARASKEGITVVDDWQSLDVSRLPQGRTVELRNAIFEYQIPSWSPPPRPFYDSKLQVEIGANQPWAEDHFQERVGGEPLNPGEQYKNWPWYRGNVEKHRVVGGDSSGAEWDYEVEPKFSHTYMERFWPKQAGDYKVWPDTQTWGLRYRLGDLNDLVNQLARSPNTRQAYLPVWFPEDTGAVHGERVPCTLGYHFLLRENRLHVTYFIRSCDFVRHFRDDVYLACRLVQWVLNRLQGLQEGEDGNQTDYTPEYDWERARPGTITMHMVSFHVFEGDLPMMRRKLK